MKISWNYLQSFFAEPLNKAMVLERLTMAGLEVEEETPVVPENLAENKCPDTIIEFKITPNRGDCLSYAGLVREISALLDVKLKLFSEKTINLLDCIIALGINSSSEITNYLITPSASFNLNVAAGPECPHYAGLIINQINNSQPTPEWLARILERSGIRLVSPVVDITNYVMLLLGQPMHAFDLAKIGNGLTVRMANEGEELKLIDGKDVKLAANTLAIADNASQPVAIAGIMGGQNSGVTAATKSIFLESAYFTPEIIRGKAKQYGVSSDSAFRFERGVDVEIQHEALNLAANLIIQICGGTAADYVHYSYSNIKNNSQSLKISVTEINNFIGEAVGQAEIIRILTNLGCGVIVDNDELSINIPSHRFDLAIKQDIIEEIVRVYGYDKIRPAMPKLHHTMPELDRNLARINKLKQILVSNGFNEIISYAFIEDKYAEILADQTQSLVKLLNPIAGLNILRNNLLSGLLKTVIHNVNRGYESLRIFELGRVFHGESANQQPLYLAGLMYGKTRLPHWADKGRDIDFFDLKFIVEELLRPFAAVIKFISDSAACLVFHPGRTAKIELNGKVIGFIGQLHPNLLQKLNLDKLPYLFEINLDLIGMCQETEVRSISKFQKVSRDLAFIFDDKTLVGDVLQKIRALSISELVSARVFDIFRGGNLKVNEKSVAFNFIFQADKTLTEEEIASSLTQIKHMVIHEFKAQLR